MALFVQGDYGNGVAQKNYLDSGALWNAFNTVLKCLGLVETRGKNITLSEVIEVE